MLLPFVAADLSLSFAEAGVVKSALNAAISITQLPAGLVGGSLGEAAILSAGLGWFSLSFLLIGFASGYLVLLALMASAGVGGGVYHPVGTSWVSRVFLGSRRGTAVGTLNFAGDLGKVALPAVAGALVLWIGWRGSLVAMGAWGIVTTLVLGAFAVRSRGRRAGRQESKNGGRGWGIAHPRQFALISVIGLIDQGGRSAVTAFLGFLLLAHGASEAALGLLVAVTFAGGAFGKFGCGWLVDRMEDRRVMVITEMAMAVGCLTLATVSAGVLLVPLLLAFGFALNGTSSVIYTRLADTLDPARFSRGYGVYYTLSFGASAASPVLYGLLADAQGLNWVFVAIAAVNLCILPLIALLPGTTGTAGLTAQD